jgi:hypothetical protein
MKNYFRCPQCGKQHAKTYRYGAVRGHSGKMVARETFHPDIVCSCGANVSGQQILGGAYDRPPLTISPKVRIAMASVANALFWGGATYVFASGTTALIVGGSSLPSSGSPIAPALSRPSRYLALNSVRPTTVHATG